MGTRFYDEGDATFKILIAAAAFVIVISLIFWTGRRTERAVDNALTQYEEFQTIHETCQTINAKLCTTRDIPENDQGFSQVSKAQTIAALKAQLDRWTNQYNAQSKMITRQLWKSPKLPYQLNSSDFSCYNEPNNGGNERK